MFHPREMEPSIKSRGASCGNILYVSNSPCTSMMGLYIFSTSLFHPEVNLTAWKYTWNVVKHLLHTMAGETTVIYPIFFCCLSGLFILLVIFGVELVEALSQHKCYHFLTIYYLTDNWNKMQSFYDVLVKYNKMISRLLIFWWCNIVNCL